MNTKAIITSYTTSQAPASIPATARGRSLHTVDWFLNGKPGKNFYDNPLLLIGDISIR